MSLPHPLSQSHAPVQGRRTHVEGGWKPTLHRMSSVLAPAPATVVDAPSPFTWDSGRYGEERSDETTPTSSLRAPSGEAIAVMAMASPRPGPSAQTVLPRHLWRRVTSVGR